MPKPLKRDAQPSYAVLSVLRQERKRQRIRQDVLAEMLGYHFVTLGRWERGETFPSFQALHDWCEGLNLKIEISRPHA